MSFIKGRSSLMHNAATCDEQDEWTDLCVAFGWLVPTDEDINNVLINREMRHMDATVGYFLH